MGRADDAPFMSNYAEPLLASSPRAKSAASTLQLSTVVTQLNSFFAVLWPVLVTMVLASLVAVHVQDANAEKSMSRYLYYKDIESSKESTGTKAVQALANAVVIIFFIAMITFAVVLLYKINCMGGLQGYLMISSATLLGLVGSALVERIVCGIFEWHVDAYSMFFVMYNFAIVGTISIFYQKGVSPDIGRAYLIVTSVIMAWQLCQLPTWSTWAILLGLAFWDLFAVLTPCGPLRCLVNLIQSEGRPMPGLLYEAEIQEMHQTKQTSGNLQQKSPLLIETTESSRDLAKFRAQLIEFCRDFNSPNSSNVDKVVLHYADNQIACWRQLYTKYNVTYVPSYSSYPSYAEVFDSAHDCQIDQNERETIKLGLGDFIFYSVLVARAAMTSFNAFIACFLCVILGLAITMYLLGFFNALPALPISILLGVSAFFWMAQVGVEYIDFLVMQGIC